MFHTFQMMKIAVYKYYTGNSLRTRLYLSRERCGEKVRGQQVGDFISQIFNLISYA